MPLVPKEKLGDYIDQEVGVSDWLEISQDRVNQFADVTNDHQFIHVDPEKAAQTPFGGPIAHGFLTLSLISHFSYQDIGVRPPNIALSINYGLDKLRFLAPVKVGSSIRARFTFRGFEEKQPGQILLKHDVTIEIKDEPKPALAATTLALVVLGEDEPT